MKMTVHIILKLCGSVLRSIILFGQSPWITLYVFFDTGTTWFDLFFLSTTWVKFNWPIPPVLFLFFFFFFTQTIKSADFKKVFRCARQGEGKVILISSDIIRQPKQEASGIFKGVSTKMLNAKNTRRPSSYHLQSYVQWFAFVNSTEPLTAVVNEVEIMWYGLQDA